ncbi:MAG: 16S rRNA (cytosine(1402)-N(4))-methyltransferase [Patescibacteria group bacterium]|jgi:16S rRNA (cytosine1402-N4)-methyltransferase
MLYHLPVMKEEVVRALALEPGQVAIDATLGLGGHARLLAAAVGPAGTVLGIERTAEGLAAAREALGTIDAKLILVHADFRSLVMEAAGAGITAADAALFDLGLASWQLDTGYQGVSFQRDAVLDLRLTPVAPTTFTSTDEDPLQWTGDATLARLVRTWRFRPASEFLAQESEPHIETVLRALGDVRQARRVAAAIVANRKHAPIETTTALREACGSDAPGLLAPVFQALRLLVNDEYGALVAGLRGAWQLLRPGGRLAVITFQSGEDRIVKHELRRGAPARLDRYRPTSDEVRGNARSRSAILRVATKTS